MPVGLFWWERHQDNFLLVTVTTDTPIPGVDATPFWPLPVQQPWEEERDRIMKSVIHREVKVYTEFPDTFLIIS